MELKYQEVNPIDFNTAVNILNVTNDINEICNILLSIGLYSNDVNAEDLLYTYFISEYIDVSRVAILSLGHLVRRNKYVNKEKFVKKLREVKFPIELRGTIEDVIDDVNIFSLDN